ncbi:MAG: protein-export chaperone SecB [Hyphomicrobiaceae bacterium]|nr:protein-export chaperone SecB [Hyphomicrobiaceae bacterium]
MADATNTGNGDAPQAPGPGIVVRMAGQYIKDLSFENPNIRRLIEAQGDNPRINVDLNVQPSKLPSNNLYEVVINFHAKAENNIGIIYDLEIAYGGIYQIENMPEPNLDPFLHVNCPFLLFPFLRRLVADITREGGFPPLLLDPVDFAQLFEQRQQQARPN